MADEQPKVDLEQVVAVGSQWLSERPEWKKYSRFAERHFVRTLPEDQRTLARTMLALGFEAGLTTPSPNLGRLVPPDGWFVFGSHVGYGGPMEFSDETDPAGDPLWERPVYDRPADEPRNEAQPPAPSGPTDGKMRSAECLLCAQEGRSTAVEWAGPITEQAVRDMETHLHEAHVKVPLQITVHDGIWAFAIGEDQ